MMHDSFEGQKHISVFETTLFIQQNTLSVRLQSPLYSHTMR